MITHHLWADDLTGGAEVAALLATRTDQSVTLGLGPAPTHTVHDLNLRHASTPAARAALAQHLATLAPTERLFLKVDSQLHGPVAGYLAAMLDGGRPVLLCAANPAMGRVTVAGLHRVAGPDGVTTTDLRELLSGVRHRIVGRDDLGPIGREPEVLVADATDQGDLAALVSTAVEHGLDLAGGAALLEALLPPRETTPPDPPRPGHLLAVVGSTEAAAQAQVEAARARPDVVVLEVGAGAPADAVAAIQRGQHVVLTRGGTTHAALADAAAAAIGALHPFRTSVLLTGGHTAREVLDRVEITRLTTVPGPSGAIVRLCADSGLTVLTKPGSYGGPDAITALLDPVAAGQELR